MMWKSRRQSRKAPDGSNFGADEGTVLMRMWRIFVFAALVILAAAAPAPPSPAGPTLRIGDPKSLESIFKFGLLPVSAGVGKPRGEVYWRIDIDVPPDDPVDRIDIPGLSWPTLHLRGGRCFEVHWEDEP